MSRPRLTLLAVVAAFAALAATVPAGAAARTTISASGSTSMQKLYIQLAKGYRKSSRRVKRNVRFLEPSGGASDVGIKEGASGRVKIGLSSRDPKSGDPGVFSKVARDAVCVTTARENPVSNISQGQVQSIFTGSVSSWSSAKRAGLSGVRSSGSIDLEVRNSRSGTADAFQNIFLGQNKFVAGSATEHRSAGAQARAIGRNENAIGYASFVNTRGMHAVPYRGVACNLRNAKSGRYFGARNFWFVTRGKPKGATKAFIRYIRRSRAAKRIIGRGFIPLR